MTLKLIKNAIFLLTYVFVTSLLVRPAFGHYLWIMQEGEKYGVCRGLIPDKMDSYHPAAVKLIKAFDPKGAEVSVEMVDGQSRVFFRADKNISLAAVMCDWGGRVNTTQGKKLMTKQEAERQGLKVLESFLSTHTSKTLFEDGASVCKDLGMKFEFVPIKSPFSLGPGEPLEIKLIFDGALLKNAIVLLDENTQTNTDKQGVARIPISDTGWKVIIAKHIVPVTHDPDVDYHQFMTFFVFMVKR